MGIKEVMNTDSGKILISVIWGLGLAALFRKVCKGRNCIVIKGPRPSEMDNKIYKFDDKCYLYTAENTKCSRKTISSK